MALGSAHQAPEHLADGFEAGFEGSSLDWAREPEGAHEVDTGPDLGRASAGDLEESTAFGLRELCVALGDI